jgi:hypothetical protein
MLPSYSMLYSPLREHLDTPAAVADRLREQLDLERSRVRHLQQQEHAAWEEIAQLRRELAASKPPPPPPGPPPPYMVETRVAATQCESTHSPQDMASALAERDYISGLVADVDALALQTWFTENGLGDLPKTRRPSEHHQTAAGVACLLDSFRMLQRKVMAMKTIQSKWVLWATAAAEREAATVETFLAAFDQCCVDLADANALALQRQQQINELMQRLDATSSFASMPTPEERSQPVRTEIIRAHNQLMDVHRNFSAVAQQNVSLRAEMQAQKMLINRLKQVQKLHSAVAASLNGAPLSAFMFEAFLRREWRGLQKRSSESPLVNIDGLVRVWRELQLHAASLLVELSHGDRSRQGPLSSSSGHAEGDVDEIQFLERLAFEHLPANYVCSVSSGPFGDTVIPPWSVDCDRLSDGLVKHLAGFLPATEADFIAFFVAFVNEAAAKTFTPNTWKGDIEPGYVVVGTDAFRDLSLLAARCIELEIERDNERLRADTLQTAQAALLSVHAQELLEMRQATMKTVDAARVEALRYCPDTNSLYTTLRTHPMFCDVCHAEQTDAVVAQLAKSAGFTLRAFEDEMLRSTAARVEDALDEMRAQSDYPRSLMRAAATDRIPALLWFLAPSQFAHLLARTQFIDAAEAFIILRYYISNGKRVATELSHADAACLLQCVHFVWLPSVIIEDCLKSSEAMQISTSGALLRDLDEDQEIGTYRVLFQQIFAQVSIAARLKLVALSYSQHGSLCGDESGLPARTPLQHAHQLGLGTGSSLNTFGPSPTHWLARHSDDIGDCAISWATFASLQRRLEERWHL